MQKITYYAWARDAAGKIRLLFVTRENGRQTSQIWMNETFKSERAASARVGHLNGCVGCMA